MKFIIAVLLFGNILKFALSQSPECPLFNDPNFTVHLPHEYDCTLFYKCNWGEAVLMECPDGLHFNPELEVCDWPAQAGCEAGGTTTGGPVDGTDAPGDTTKNPNDTTKSPGDTTSGPGNGICPPENGQWAVHLPHEYDCTLFYKCNWGEAVLMECPDGLHFNPELEVCDWPAQAGCEAGGTTTGGPVDGTDAPGDTTKNPNDTTKSPGDTTSGPGNGICPPENGQWAVHLPHEYDCTLFYKCNWGEAVLMECPDGLHFNPELEVCDWPAQAGCEAGGTTTGGPVDGTDAPGDTTKNPNDTTKSPGDTTSGPGNEICPPENGQWAVHLPHEYDCTLFYKCNWGEAVLMECPDDLHFNPELEVCDWPQDAGCIL